MIRFLLIILLPLASIGVFGQTGLPDLPLLLDQNKNEFGLTPQDIQEYSVSDSYTTEHLNLTHVYLEQRFQDIRVFNGILNLNLSGNSLVSYGNRWIPDIKSKTPASLPGLTAQSAVERAANHLGHNFPNAVEISRLPNKLGQFTKFTFEGSNLSQVPITVELVWLSGEQKNVFLCWKVDIAETDNENVWNIFIDAHSGIVVRQDNQVQHCAFDTPDFSCMEKSNPLMVQPQPENLMVVADSSYNVFPVPIESPNHGPRAIVTRPWTLAGNGNFATTLRWHNNGTTNYTSTRGNNVHAYEDINHDNLPGISPDTFNLRFDYPFTPSIDPTVNLKSCITNLFYWNNIMHDVTYQYGFNEVAGNFQNSNLNRGGLGADYVKAEAQDGGGTNNANFYTPADGTSGRMQMYIWDAVPATSPLTINSPLSIAGSMWAAESGFSTNNKLSNIGHVAGNLLLVNDTGNSTHLACGTLSNGGNLAGKIAVIDRGTCDFTVKVKNVQNLGAIAAIVINNDNTAPLSWVELTIPLSFLQ